MAKTNNQNSQETVSKLIDEQSVGFDQKLLKYNWISTPIGIMLAIGDEKELYLLEFIDGKGLASEIEKLCKKTKSSIHFDKTHSIVSIEKELNAYFKGNLKVFNTPLSLLGTPFQKLAWKALQKIPFGKTKSYAQLAENIGKPSAYRAVANANGANQLAIVIPCHRIINSNGELGGYGGTVERKKWLLEHEKAF